MGFLRRVMLLGVVVAAAWAGWRWGGRIFPGLEAWVAGRVEHLRASRDGGGEADPALAEAAMLRYDAFAAGEGADSLVLRAAEVSSLLRHALPGIVPPGASHPTVRFEDGAALVRVEVALSALPRVPELEGILEMLPETVPLELRGVLEPRGPGELALRATGIEASRIPIPRRFFPSILEALGREDRPRLPADAVAVPLPPGVGSAYIAADRLVLTRR